MTAPCFNCGAARSCRHRTVEPIDRSRILDRVDGRGRAAAAFTERNAASLFATRETSHG